MIVLILKEEDAKEVCEAILETKLAWKPVHDRVTKEIQSKLDIREEQRT